MKTVGAPMESGLSAATPSAGYRSIVRAFARISWKPGTLFLALLLINSVARPYSDLIHDSRLYAVMVLDRADPGLYSDDLFLRYGSQDRFSLFSRLVAPLTEHIGLRPTFFLLYLISSALVLYSAQRFVLSFVRQRVIAALALFYLAVNPLIFGGLGVFHVNETFLTPRLWAIALVFFALEQLVHDRRWRSLLLITCALMIHPIMAFSGLLVWLYVTLTASLSIRRVIAIGVVCGLILVLALICFGGAVLGPMDGTWRRYIVVANEYIDPSEWFARDWLRIVIAFAITIMARQQLCYSASVRRCLDAIMFVALVGLVGAAVATHLPYALPIQGQQYRAVWLLQFIQIPLAVSLLRHMWWSGSSYARPGAVALGIVLAVGTMTMNGIQIASSAGVLLLCRYGGNFGRREAGVRPGWGASMLWGFGLVACIAPLLAPIMMSWNSTLGMPSPADVMRCVPMAIGPLITLLAAFVSVVALYRWTGGARRFGIAALGGFLTIQTLFFVAAQRGHSPYKRNIVALRQFVERHYGETNRLPTVYWPRSGLDNVWFGLQAKCYFTKGQAAGNMFNRGTAMECQRRALVVRPFELSEIARSGPQMHKRHIRALLKMLGEGPESGDPTLRDLYRLCCEEIDVVITREQFDGLYSEKIGPFFVYECAEIRESIRETLAQGGVTKTVAIQN